MDRFKKQARMLKHELANELGKAWVDFMVDPELIAGGEPLVGEVALQNSNFIYGLIACYPDLSSVYTDKTIAARCARYGIAWTRCSGPDDIYRCVRWAIEQQDKITGCQVRPMAA